MSGNTILITGGASGIGIALAEQFKKLGNEVIVASRSQDKLRAVAEKGFETFSVDMTDAGSIATLADDITRKFPRLNIVLHNAGIMKNENLIRADHKGVAQETVATNLLGPILLTEALLPHLLQMPQATIMAVTSGLAFTPLAMTPTYCASKAGIHAYAQCLRYQLKDTNVNVLEIVPPYVQTQLMGERQAQDPMAMPLDDFVSEVMHILSSGNYGHEILVERVMPLRNSAQGGIDAQNAFFEKFNDTMFAARRGEW